MTSPRVSVLLGTRNGERFLSEALDSLARQTFRDFELIAVDDSSTDRTSAQLEAFASEHDWCRVLRTEGIGLAGSLAMAAREARGELFARQDDDDLSQPTRFERQVAEFDRIPSLGVLGSAARVIDEQGQTLGDYPVPLEQSAIQRTLQRATPFVHGAVMLRRSVYEAAGGYREVFRASQDLDLWLRLPAGTGLANLPEPLYHWRKHAGGTYARAREAQLFYSAAARAFVAERRHSGTDSANLLRSHSDPMSFAASYRRSGDFLRIHGELLVRDGRTVPARRALAAALRAGRWDALPWWLISWPVAFTPRGRAAEAKP